MCRRVVAPSTLDEEDSGNTDRKAVVGRNEVASLAALLVVAITAGWVLLGR